MNNETGNWKIIPICLQPEHIECTVAIWIWNILSGILIVLGTCGNSLSICVMFRKRLRTHSTSIYILFLAISDVTFLYSSVSRHFLLGVMDTDMKNWSSSYCTMKAWLTYTAAGFSVWLLVLLTVERTVVIVWPIKARTIATRKTALIACISLLLCVASIAGPLLFMYELKMPSESRTNVTGTSTVMKTTPVCLPKTDSNKNFLNGQLLALLLITNNVIPFIIIVTGNVTIALKLTLQKIRRRRMRAQTGEHTSTGLDDRRQDAAKMVLFLCGFFLLTTTPYTGFNITRRFYFRNAQDPKTYARLQLAHAVVLNLLYCNYTFNFWLYFASGSLFKAELKEMASSLRHKLASLRCWLTRRNAGSTRHITIIELIDTNAHIENVHPDLGSAVDEGL